MNDDELKQSIADLGLTSDPSDLDAVRLEIKTRISELHPDHKANHSDDRLQKLTELLKNAGPESKGLQLVTGPTKLAKFEPAASILREPVETRIHAATELQQKASARGFLFPKISLAAVTAALGWVFVFPRAFMDHPFVGGLLRSRYAIEMWLIVLFALVASWLTVWWIQQLRQRMIERVMSLGRQRAALDVIGNGDEGSFSASQFRESLYPRHTWYPTWLSKTFSLLVRKKLYYFHNPLYDVTLADQATELALERFVNKGWIVRAKRPKDATGVDDWYKFV